jgi:hypothetical protein
LTFSAMRLAVSPDIDGELAHFLREHAEAAAVFAGAGRSIAALIDRILV